jgi:hypothetical protein
LTDGRGEVERRVMGKAGDNERLKLRASLLNNVAAGLILGGVFLPAFTLISKMDEVSEWVFHVAKKDGTLTISGSEALKSFLTLVAFVLALWAAGHLSRSAEKEIEKIKD